MIMTQQKQGVFFALAAFLMWGLAPIYFKEIDHIAALEILMHRVVWSCVLLVVIILVIKQWHKVKTVLLNTKLMLGLVVTSLLLGFNWGLFIWAVNNDHILDASLGYYINPLLNVLLGVLFLGESLRRMQLVAVGLAVFGVILQLISFGSFPVIAFSLASSFAVYGLLRKKMPVESLPGLLIESLIMLPFALLYWVFFVTSEQNTLYVTDLSLATLLVCAGVVTTAPLLCFIAASRRLTYTTLGFFQYLGPSLMFILAVALYGEVFSMDRVITFAFIWSALALFSFDSYRNRQKLKAN